jgi:hypothetical protein
MTGQPKQALPLGCKCDPADWGPKEVPPVCARYDGYRGAEEWEEYCEECQHPEPCHVVLPDRVAIVELVEMTERWGKPGSREGVPCAGELQRWLAKHASWVDPGVAS